MLDCLNIIEHLFSLSYISSQKCVYKVSAYKPQVKSARLPGLDEIHSGFREATSDSSEIWTQSR